MFLAMLRTQV